MKKCFVFVAVLVLFIIAFGGAMTVANAESLSTDAPARGSEWALLGSMQEGDCKYVVYRHKTQTKEECVGEFVRALVDVNEASVSFAYTATEATTHTINFETEVTVKGKAGFVASGTWSVSGFFNLSQNWTIGKGVTLSRTLINATNNPIGIYQLKAYTTKRKYAVDVYEAKKVQKTRTYQEKEGKNTVTKTETYYVQEGWTYCGSYETYFLDVDRNGRTIQTLKVERVADVPSVVC